jgi:RHS repeat-associated protein
LTDSTIRNQVNGIIGGNRTTYGFRYTYNDGGMVTRMEYPDGAVHTYTYDDNLGRLQRIGEGAQGSAPTDFVYGLEYNRSGVVTRMNYANGTTQRWGFDNRKRISAISITGPAGVIENLAYRYDGGGNLLSINDNEYVYDGFGRIAGARTLIPGQVDHYKLVEESFGTYQAGDPINGAVFNPLADLNGDGRISGADHSIASFEDEGEQYDIESFTYDRNGNRTLLIQNDDEYTYEYDLAKNNQLKKVYVKKAGTTTRKLFAEYFYDANGNTVKRVIHKPEGPETVTFAYDTMNRVVMTQNGPRTIEYTYDNAGNRLYKKESGGALTVYLRHGQIAVAMDIELTPESTTERGSSNRYLLSGDLLAGRVTTTRNLDGTTTVKKSWYHLDHLNSTKCITDAAGVIEVNYTYRAFGEQLRRLAADGTPTEDVAKYSYGGKELDEEIGLYYFNARYYDATLGRFISLDPIQDGSNWYVYCSNNPLCFVDPSGLLKLDDSLTEGTIEEGDDFEGIASFYYDKTGIQLTANEIAEYNGIEDQTSIKPGDVLYFPTVWWKAVEVTELYGGSVRGGDEGVTYRQGTANVKFGMDWKRNGGPLLDDFGFRFEANYKVVQTNEVGFCFGFDYSQTSTTYYALLPIKYTYDDVMKSFEGKFEFAGISSGFFVFGGVGGKTWGFDARGVVSASAWQGETTGFTIGWGKGASFVSETLYSNPRMVDH